MKITFGLDIKTKEMVQGVVLVLPKMNI